MNDAQAWRIQQLEGEVKSLKEDMQALRTLRDQLTGLGWAAKWGIRILFALGGWGAIDGVIRLMQWLGAPFPKGH